MRLDRTRFTPFLLLLAAASCAQKAAPDNHTLTETHQPGPQQYAKLAPDEIRSEVLSFADTYVTITTQALDELEKQTKSTEVAAWALRYKIATASAALTSSTSPNPIISLLDTVILVTLKRVGLEEHWIPTLLHEEGSNVLATFIRTEADAWKMANRVLTPAQIAEMRTLISQWRKDHPGQYYENHIRFADFNDARHTSERSGRPPPPGSIFALLFIDPMARMDPVARELRSYRLLSERIFFLAKRAPMLISWEVESAIMEAGENRQTQRFLNTLNSFDNHLKTFNETTTAFTATLSKYPRDLAHEREALIKEFLAGMTEQRKAIFEGLTAQRQALHLSITTERQAMIKDVEAEHGRLSGLLADARVTLKDLRDTSAAINSSANSAIAQAEDSSTRVTSRIFIYLLTLLLVGLIVGPIMLLVYRYASRRLPPAPSDSNHSAATSLQTR